MSNMVTIHRIVRGGNAIVEARKPGTNSVVAVVAEKEIEYKNEAEARANDSCSHVKDAIEELSKQGLTVVIPRRYIKSLEKRDMLPSSDNLVASEDTDVKIRPYAMVEVYDISSDTKPAAARYTSRKGKRTKASQVRDLLKDRADAIRKGDHDSVINEIMELGNFKKGLAKQYFNNLGKELGVL